MVKLNCSLTPYNYGDMAEMIRYAEDNRLILEANSYMFPPLRRDRDSVGRNDRFTPEQAAEVHIQRCRMQYGQEQFGKFIKDIASGKGSPPGLDEACIDAKDGRINCRAGKSSFWITWDGMMMPCGMMPEPAQDVLQQNPVQAWRKIAEESAQIRLSGICGSCDSRGICHSCAATAMAETGSLTGVPRYLCRMAERMREIARSTVEDID